MLSFLDWCILILYFVGYFRSWRWRFIIWRVSAEQTFSTCLDLKDFSASFGTYFEKRSRTNMVEDGDMINFSREAMLMLLLMRTPCKRRKKHKWIWEWKHLCSNLFSFLPAFFCPRIGMASIKVLRWHLVSLVQKLRAEK